MKREFITYKSPAIGLRKKDIKLILGKKLKINVRMDEPLKLKFFK